MDQEDQLTLKEILKLEQRVKGGSTWFFLIGGLSVVNSLVVMFGGGVTFIVGLGATLFIDVVATGVANQVETMVGNIVQLLGFMVTLGIAGLFVLFGFFARKKHQWAFVVGIVLYTIDGLFLLVLGEFLSVGFHLFALLGLGGGLMALRKLKAIEAGELRIVTASPPLSQTLPSVQKQPRTQRYWLKLIIPTLIVLIPFFFFLIFLFTYE